MVGMPTGDENLVRMKRKPARMLAISTGYANASALENNFWSGQDDASDERALHNDAKQLEGRA